MTLTTQSAAQSSQLSFIVEYAIILFRRQTKCTKVRKIPSNNFQVNNFVYQLMEKTQVIFWDSGPPMGDFCEKSDFSPLKVENTH